ncbi:MAG: 6-bladed beta-propeller [Bacteroidales bacterium]|jgi:hypothetical protein
MKTNSALTLLLCILLMACSGPKQQPSAAIIKIDVLKAFDNQKNVKLSEFIRDVEFIPLESTKDCWFRYSENYIVGKKYVMVGDSERAHIVLFDRKGKFVRTIGTKVKGPGELIEPRNAVMDPDEEFVMVYDSGKSKLSRFSITGKFMNEIDIKGLIPTMYITNIQFINDKEFVLVNHRPYAPMEEFASLPVFDRNLNHVRDILPRANDENLRINVQPHAVFTINPERMTFWEPHLDTLYTITPEGSAIPTHVIGFSKGGPDDEFVSTNVNPNLYSDNSIVSIMDAGQYFHIMGRKDNSWFTALYNKKTNEIFEVVQKPTCDTTKNASRIGFENDLFGSGRGWLRIYSKQIDRFITLIDLETSPSEATLECIRKKEVKFPELRNRYLELLKDPEVRYQKLIVLMESSHLPNGQ